MKNGKRQIVYLFRFTPKCDTISKDSLIAQHGLRDYFNFNFLQVCFFFPCVEKNSSQTQNQLSPLSGEEKHQQQHTTTTTTAPISREKKYYFDESPATTLFPTLNNTESTSRRMQSTNDGSSSEKTETSCAGFDPDEMAWSNVVFRGDGSRIHHVP